MAGQVHSKGNPMAPGEGRQVVSVTAEHGYSLKEEALRDILLRDDVKDLPVVVVSVAGAYRGGKSFILDFFLRYLLATPEQRETGAWIGSENEPLKGFKWRLGTERETTGINLWSEPILATLDSGVKVAVLLMDTQGTFDSESTIRDCSTIFALSTLISSVQIYNLKENIKEDDLQNLQLFARYGALARGEGEGGKAFQVLQFLVRDWQNPTECPYGAEGGAKLLRKRLEITDKQKEELKSLREQLVDTFERLICFVMPHPGFSITDPKFSGCVNDLREEFRMSVLELVPSIFDTWNLTPKIINGDRVKAKDLFEYFKTYMRIFNSNELPEPTTILKATSEAGLLMAMRNAREMYDEKMEVHCGSNKPSVSPTRLESLHRETMQAALDAFNNKKKLGSKEDCDTYLAQLTQELEDCLPGFVTSNNAKIRSAVTKAKETYEAKLSEVRGLNQLCLHPEDFKEFHRNNVEAILSEFDLTRRVVEGENDSERCALVQHFDTLSVELCRTNEQNNEAMVRLIRETYITRMERSFESRSCATARRLERNHQRAHSEALLSFEAKRNRTYRHPVDVYKTDLIDTIESRYENMKMTNKTNNRTLVQTVMYTYNNCMASVSNNTFCLHPVELDNDHKAAKAQALEDFAAGRLADDDEPEDNGDEPEDEYKTKLLTELDKRYQDLCKQNEANNQMAVEAALAEYARKMDQKCGATLLSLLVVPLIAKILIMLPRYHKRYSKEARRVFWSRRRNKGDFGKDSYVDDLNKRLEEGYTEYCGPVQAVARELGLPLPPPFGNDADIILDLNNDDDLD